MGRKVLVLNQDYTALSVCSVQKAFMLVFGEKAEMVVEDQLYQLRTVTKRFPVPSIIRLNRYVSLPFRSGVMLSRQNIFRRDGNQCQYCGSTKDLTLDHVLPRSKGGKSSWENLITACKSCNSKKGDYLPQEMGLVMKQKPFKPSFVMFLRDFSNTTSEDWLLYLGKRGKNSYDA
jgi:5-methylcytosine-specific restriction endonuclease McrA